jgi:hypothetical protein
MEMEASGTLLRTHPVYSNIGPAAVNYKSRLRHFNALYCMMSVEVPFDNSAAELPHALAAAIASQKRNFWGVCAVRRPLSLARYDFLSFALSHGPLISD